MLTHQISSNVTSFGSLRTSYRTPASTTPGFDLDVLPRRAHNEDIMPNNFDPSIGAATRWRKGHPSLNPGGRPKSRLLSEALRVQLGQLMPGDLHGRSYAEAIAGNLIAIACSQNHSAVSAAAEIANRLEGRAMQRLE
jgi:hypothetical protein